MDFARNEPPCQHGSADYLTDWLAISALSGPSGPRPFKMCIYRGPCRKELLRLLLEYARRDKEGRRDGRGQSRTRIVSYHDPLNFIPSLVHMERHFLLLIISRCRTRSGEHVSLAPRPPDCDVPFRCIVSMYRVLPDFRCIPTCEQLGLPGDEHSTIYSRGGIIERLVATRSSVIGEPEPYSGYAANCTALDAVYHTRQSSFQHNPILTRGWK